MPHKLKKAIKILNQGHFEQSIAIFQKILQSQRINHNSLKYNKQIFHLVIAYIEICQPEKSQKLCRQIIQLSPYEQQAYIYLTLSLGQLLEYQNAIQIFNKGIDINEKNWKLYYVKGYVLYEKGDYQEASGCLGFAITKNKINNPKCYILQAACFAALYDLESARKNIQYSIMAMSQDKKRNCQDLYEYQINNIQGGLKIYQRYKKKLNKYKEISVTDKQKIQLQLIKIVNKSISYGETLKNSYKQTLQLSKPLQIVRQKQQSSQISKIGRNSSMNQELQKIQSIFALKSKNSIRTQSLETEERNREQERNLCDWLKQTCTIF